jgi:aminopyrrolnitrin oxygenase
LNSLGPKVPRNWYLVAYAAELSVGKIISRFLGSAEVIIYRGQQTKSVHAFAAHCAHMGCHLKNGRVIGDRLQCGLHHRAISPSGTFSTVEGNVVLQQRVYPSIEAFGAIFVFAGEAADFDLPIPEICKIGRVQTASVNSHEFPLAWQALIANGMDIDHLLSVHDRRLLAEPTFKRVDKQRICLTYQTEPTGKQFGDRITRLIATNGVHGTITSIAGSMMLVESEVGKNKSFIMMSMNPKNDGGTIIRCVVGVQARKTKLGSVIAANVTAWLFKAFLKKDIGVLEDLKWHEPIAPITRGDKYTAQLCEFFRELPHV